MQYIADLHFKIFKIAYLMLLDSLNVHPIDDRTYDIWHDICCKINVKIYTVNIYFHVIIT